MQLFNVNLDENYIALAIAALVVVLLSFFMKPSNGSEQGAASNGSEQVALTTEDQNKQIAVNAVATLAAAAASPEAVAVEQVAPVANIAASATTTQQGADAVQALANQAITNEAGDPAKVESAAIAAVQSM
jgi:hypothetical protein